MRAISSTASLVKSGLAAAGLLLAASAAFAQVVNLTAAPTQTVLPDGQTVPMWGYSCGASIVGSTAATCSAANPNAAGSWSPVVITVPYSGTGTNLSINLTNNLSFGAGSGANRVPTSLVIVGQLGGGLGSGGTKTASPAHAPIGVSWFAADTSARAITITNPGSGYSPASPPNVTFSGGGGTGGTATPIVSADGTIAAISITDPGTGYMAAPSISIDAPGGTGTQATATVSGLTDFLSAGGTKFTSPAQPDRVQSFATEVAAAGATLVPSQVASGTTLTWSNLRPGTYLIESGTHPSIQGPMGLYGVLVVTTPGTPSQAYPGVTYDADIPLVLSEIDPVQNRAVAAAVTTVGFKETKVWSGQPNQCGDPNSTNYNTCYPPAVNYSPLYYLINGVSFDRTNLSASTFSTLSPLPPAILGDPTLPVTATTGKVLLRFVNAGLRMHVPSVVNATMTLYAEDGNLLPGNPRQQSEVFLAAGKTYDATIQPAQPGGNYSASTYAVYDRQLSLSTNNQRDGGMQAYIAIAGGASSGSGSAGSGSTLSASDKTFYCVSGQPLVVADQGKGVLGGSTGANGASLVAGSLLVAGNPPPPEAHVSLQSDGTFSYTPPSSGTCAASFNFLVNGKFKTGSTPYTATIAQCDASVHSDPNCKLGLPPTVSDDSYTSPIGPSTIAPVATLHIAPPGILLNDTDPSGLPMTVDVPTVTATTPGLTVAANADGSFTASASVAGKYTFTYNVKNSQGSAGTSAPANASKTAATVTVEFQTASNLKVNLTDAISGDKVTDYRWIIEEDKTFYIDPQCQINSKNPALRPASCPPLPVQSAGYNFHTANMPVVATGCVGDISCESGQTVLGAATACDIGNGTCRTDGTPKKVALDPSQVHLDPNKRYFLSVMPGDGVNPTLNGQGGAIDTGKKDGNNQPILRQFQTIGGTNNLGDCTSFDAGSGNCGHTMGGAEISGATVSAGQTALNIKLQRTPLPTAQISVFVFEDDNPLNGENDAGGGVDVIAPNEPGLGGFNIVLFDQAGGLGDNTGQPTYDMFNQPLTNGLAGTMDPLTGLDACPLTKNPDNLVGMIVTCPKFEADGKTPSPLAGQAVIKNLYPGLYEVQAFPAADRIARGEEWLQSNTLDGGKPHEAFIKPNEQAYFQEFGPGGFHVSIGFANPKIINDRLTNSKKTGLCDLGTPCPATLFGRVTNARMSRTPDQRIYSSGDYTAYGFTQCYVGIGPPDGPDFGLAKCDPNGNFEFDNIPEGDFKLSVFDQWNDIMLDGLVSSVSVKNGATTQDNRLVFPVTQWRTNLYTRTFIDLNGDGVSTHDSTGVPCTATNTPAGCNPNYGSDTEPGLPLAATNIRYRDGSFGFFNNTDLNGYAGFNEVFPFMNWLVVETDSTRYKPSGTHVVYDAGGPADGSTGGANSTIAAGLANTFESNSVPLALRVPGAVYCDNADCKGFSIANGPYGTNTAGSGPLTGLSSGRVDPPQPWGNTEGWQGLLGQSTFMEFGLKPFVTGENGGIKGHVIYASTRPFDDPELLLQLSWEPAVPHVQINLYQEGTDANGQPTLKLADTTSTSSFDDWAQGFRRDANGNPIPYTYTDAQNVTHTGYIPNMNCPGQPGDSPFFATLQGSTEWLDTNNPKLPLAANSQFKCYDGWSQLNQAQPAPYDGMYKFPSVTKVDPATGRPAGTNCAICVDNPSGDGTKMLPPGRYVVEVIVPPGFELVKEEDKNILLGDIYVAPVTVQFPGVGGNVFIMPDQAAVAATYNKNSLVNQTTNLGSTAAQRHEGDTGTIEAYWPCVGAKRIVPDYNSLFPGAQQTAPFAGATRSLCDRKEVILEDQASVLAKFYVFTPAHIAGHFTGTMTNDFASEFDPFSPQFGEKFGPPNLPVGMRDFSGNEMTRVYADQWGLYDGLFYSSWEVNPPNPTGYAPQMAIACMNDPGPILDTRQTLINGSPNPTYGQMITDPSYSPAYSNFCYETPFMPGFTAYMDTPVIPTQAFADGYNLPDAEYPDATPAISNVVGSDGVAGPWVSATGASHTLTITALGDKVVQNPDFSGPNAADVPNHTFNQKTITRHYGFGSCTLNNGVCSNGASITIAGVPAPISSWADGSITVAVPTIPANFNAGTGVGSTCASTDQPGVGQTPQQRPVNGQPSNAQNNAYRCGQLVITAASGKQSIDAVTVTVAGKSPTVITGENLAGNAIQTAIDAATPGDLIIVKPGVYKEHLLMWKPVRLQGVGAASVTINADAHPSGILDSWRRQVNCLFGLAINGVPYGAANPKNPSYDPSGQYSCPDSQYLRVDRMSFEAIVGWDASGNGNLAQVLQEPTLMGAYEGAGITVLGRGVRIPRGSSDFWGINATGGAGAFTDGSVYLTSNDRDCSASTTSTNGRDYGTSNFLCNPSRIDGLSVTNSSQGGGAVFIHGWAHNLEVANTRIFANHGTLTGGINLGNGETPDAYINDGVECGVNPPVMPCPPIPRNTARNAAIPFQFNTNVHVHHNDIYDNASIGDALFSGTPSGAGAVTISAGADNYQLDHNWIAGNLSTGDGGGVVHLGLSFNGKINHNWILFNQSTNPTLPTNGGGLAILGANLDQFINGVECGSFTDNDCPPGLGEGTGPGLVIDSNLIVGNSAESGSGGGLRLQQINGTEIGAFPNQSSQWYDVTVTNNIIANNVAGWDGAGVSLEDALKVSIVNNTIVSNDTTASAGVLFKTLGAVNASSPPPGCVTDITLPQNPACTDPNAAHVPQPAGLVTDKHTPNLIASLAGLNVRCPDGYGYSGGTGQGGLTNGNCRLLSSPNLTNDLFWQNRAFHVELSGKGSGLQSQQNLVTLVPALNQTSTGFCATSGFAADGKTAASVNYWDVGMRGDAGPNDGAGGAKLSLTNSILTPIGVTYGGSNNRYPTSSPVIAPICNGSRVPPENGGHGYLAPPGRSETTGLSTVFTFNNITPAATVDEGNNWINLGYGPLALFNTAGQAMVMSGTNGSTAGAYSIGSASDAVNNGTNTQTASGVSIPQSDFFGNPRAKTNANKADIGAVEYQLPNVAVAAVTPTSLAFGGVVAGTTSALQTLTLANSGGGDLTTINVVITAPFVRTGGTCGATLLAGSTCTIFVQYAAPSPAGTQSTGTVTITANVAVTGSPVQLTGNSTAPPAIPTLTLLDNFNRNNANTLGGNWQQFIFFGTAGERVNGNQALCTGGFCSGGAGSYWNGSPVGTGTTGAAAFTFTGATLNGNGLYLKANGNFLFGVYTNAIRVRYNAGQVIVETTANGGLNFTLVGTLAGTFATGNTLTAQVDAAGTVSVWKTAAGTSTFLGQAAAGAAFSGNGRIGMFMAAGATVDNFSGK